MTNATAVKDIETRILIEDSIHTLDVNALAITSDHLIILDRIMTEARVRLARARGIYYCVVCHEVPVNPSSGEDTCYGCVKRI